MTDPQPTRPTQSSQPTSPTHPTVRRESLMLDLPLIIEQLQDQIDQLHTTVETQQMIIEQHAARLAALEPQQPS